VCISPTLNTAYLNIQIAQIIDTNEKETEGAMKREEKGREREREKEREK